MKFVNGNLITLFKESKIDVLIHGCNCFHTMGAGIAKAIKESFPEVYLADKSTKYGDKEKLGSYSVARLSINNNEQFIVNAYTQFNYGRGKDLFNYETFPNLLLKIKDEFGHLRLGLPLIGCGLAGGNESKIIEMISDNLDGVDYTIVELDQNKKIVIPQSRKIKP